MLPESEVVDEPLHRVVELRRGESGVHLHTPHATACLRVEAVQHLSLVGQVNAIDAVASWPGKALRLFCRALHL